VDCRWRGLSEDVRGKAQFAKMQLQLSQRCTPSVQPHS
jgi:hypothetical protein